MNEILTGSADMYRLPNGDWFIKILPPKNKYNIEAFEKEYTTYEEAKAVFDNILQTARKCGLRLTRG